MRDEAVRDIACEAEGDGSSGLDARLERGVASLVEVLLANGRTVACALAYICLSVAFNWGRDHIMGQSVFGGSIPLSRAISAGEIANLLFLTVYLFRLKPGGRGSRLNVATVCFAVAFAFGSVGLTFFSGEVPLLVAALAIGVGYGGMVVMLFRGISSLPTRKMVVVVASGFFSTWALSPFMGAADNVAGSVAAILAVVFACAATVYLASGCSAAGLKPYVPSWRLVAFAMVIPFVFGYCSSALAGVDTLGAFKLGYAVSAGFALVYAIVPHQRFSLLVIHWVTFPLIIVGCASVLIFDAPSGVTKALVSAGLASIYILAYMLVRVRSHNPERDSAPAYAMITGLIVLGSQAGMTCQPAIAAATDSRVVAVVFILAVLVVYGILVLQPNGRSQESLYSTMQAVGGKLDPVQAASKYGLSQRETEVYALMVGGLSAAQIADEFCISAAATRTHMSRIYAKMGIHSRKQFDEIAGASE